MTRTTMKTTTSALRAALQADVPVLAWGPPGVGKTATVEALAQEEGAHLETLIGSTVDPTDVGGLPVVVGENVRLEPPPWARRIHAALSAERSAWLFLDELSCAPPSVQAALLRVVNDRFVGDLDLRGVRILAAANPADMAADGGDLSAATANRWLHMEWPLDVEGWAQGEALGWGRGAERSEAHREDATTVTSFIRAHQAALLRVPDHSARGGAWPSPRSWSRFIAALSCVPGKDTATRAMSDVGRLLAQGLVGVDVAAEFGSYISSMDLPSPEDILAGRATMPKEQSQLAAAAYSMCNAALIDREDRDERVLAAWSILAKLRADLALSCAQMLRVGAPDSPIPDEALELADRVRGVR